LTIVLTLLISGGDSFGANRNIYKIYAKKIPSGVTTTFHIFADDKEEANELISLNGWKVINIEAVESVTESENDILSSEKDILSESQIDINNKAYTLYKNANIDNHTDIYPNWICKEFLFLGEVFFDIGEFEADFSSLDNLTFSDNYTYFIYGHTDSLLIKSNPYFKTNYELSILRAKSVKDYIVKLKGIDEKNIIITGFGAFYPRRDNDIDGEAENRRVEIYECR
jgi:hypothetical protein